MRWLQITKVPGKLDLGRLMVSGFALLLVAGCGGGGGGDSEPVAGVQSGTSVTSEPSVVTTGAEGIPGDVSSDSGETAAPSGEQRGGTGAVGDLAGSQETGSRDPGLEPGTAVEPAR